MKILMLIFALIGALVGVKSAFPLAWIGKAAVPESVAPDLLYTGSIWNGAVNNIDGIGSLAIKTSVKNFLSGKPPISFNSLSPGFAIQGRADLSSVTSLRVNGAISDLSVTDVRLADLGGAFDVNLKDIKVGPACENAEGTISTDVLMKNVARWQWRGPMLSGPVICENGEMVFTLAGNDQQQSIKAVLRLNPLGNYRAIVNVVSNRPEVDAILPLYGFEKTAAGYQLSEAGRWQ